MTQPWPVWLSWLERHPIHEKTEGLISSKGTHLSCEFYPQSGSLQEAADRRFFLTSMFLSLSLPPFFSL